MDNDQYVFYSAYFKYDQPEIFRKKTNKARPLSKSFFYSANKVRISGKKACFCPLHRLYIDFEFLSNSFSEEIRHTTVICYY